MKNNKLSKLKSQLSLVFAVLMAILLAFAVAPHYNANPMPIVYTILALGVVLSFDRKGMSNYATELVISDTQYAGTFASYFWLPATFGSDTIRKGLVYVQDGIKKKHTIGRMDFSKPYQPRQATPVSKGSFSVTGRSLEPQDLMLYTEFNPRDYEQHWLAEQLSPTLLARELPPTAENFMLQMALNRAMEQSEIGIWMASTAYKATGSAPAAEGDANYQIQFYDGFMKKFLNDSAVGQVASPVALTASNILAKMDACIEKMATQKKALLTRANRYDRLKFIISVETEILYNQALAGLTFKGNTTNEGGTKPYKGYQVVSTAGFPDDTILFAEGLMDTSSNLYVGMNSTEDNNLQLMRLQNNSELFFLKGLQKFDVQYGFSEEIVLYTTLVAGDFE